LIELVKRCKLVVTDSNGLQKEAYFAGKKDIGIMLDTGWKELVECVWNVLKRPFDLKEKLLDVLSKKLQVFLETSMVTVRQVKSWWIYLHNKEWSIEKEA